MKTLKTLWKAISCFDFDAPCLELPGQEIPELFTHEVKPEKVKEDPNQIKLF